MSRVGPLYRELDPLRPLDADEERRYVDWQRELDPDASDVKSRLVRAFIRNASRERPITRLLTGHKGCGKTTELNRVKRQLEQGVDGKRVFVATLFAQRWLDLQDLEPEDVVLQIVRQFVAELVDEGMSLGEKQFGDFFRELWGKAKRIRLEKADIDLQPLKFSFALADFPTARAEFRELLRGHLPDVFDLVNNELLPRAREFLAERGYDDILLIVDDLDKIPRKILAGGQLTNHESLFLDNAGTLRAIMCSLLLTVPIELAYSPAQGRLRDDYGASLVTVPLISINDEHGNCDIAGEDALIEILGRRAQLAFGVNTGDAFGCAVHIFGGEELLRRVVRLSGGHVRSLLVLASELLDWVDELPVPVSTVERYVPRAAKDLARALTANDRKLLAGLDRKTGAPEDDRFWDLVRNQYVFAYESGDGYWYGVNPLLRELDL